MNSFRFGYNRTYAAFTNPAIDGPGAAAFGFKNIPAEAIAKGNGGIPQISISNYNALGTRNFRPQFQSPELFQFLEALSWVRGAHTLRFGFETRQKNNLFQDLTRTVPNYSFGGRFTGESMADMLTGYLQTFEANTQTNVEQLQKAYAGYVQDDWKVTPRLTVNLGLRYEYTTPFYGKKPIQKHQLRSVEGRVGLSDELHRLPGECRPQQHRGRASASPIRCCRRSWCCAAATGCSIRVKISSVRISTCL
ncbi:MAG: TonB-dependent receptor [Hyphomicrobium sp.]